MRYLLDTNVLSEPARPHPEANVLAWLEAQPQIDLAISVLTLGEIGKATAGHRRPSPRGYLGARSELRPWTGPP